MLTVQNPYPQGERLLYSFASQEDLKLWTVFSDKQYGGKSTAELTLSGLEPVSPCCPGIAHACIMIYRIFSYRAVFLVMLDDASLLSCILHER